MTIATLPDTRPAYILTGPRALGGLLWHHAREIAEHLLVDAVAHMDNGVEWAEPQAGQITITHSDPEMPHGAVQFVVADEAGLLHLVHALRQLRGGVEMVNIPEFLRCRGEEMDSRRGGHGGGQGPD